MKIAQIAPLAESVPPKLYGGTERVVSYLTEELMRMGHGVTLFASGDSQTTAELVECWPRALRLDCEVRDALPLVLNMLERVRRRAQEFDVLHFHVDHLHLPFFRMIAGKTLTTLHGRLDCPGIAALYRNFNEMPLVSISESQRAPMKMANWIGTVHHGLPSNTCGFNRAPIGDYLAFLGRISPEKRVDRAIDIARRAGMRLRIAAKIDAAEEVYFSSIIAPRLTESGVEFVGEVNEEQKCELLRNATALLFPIDWPEPFGLAMIEAMSCGTPVIAWPHGAVPEVVDEGTTGFIVSSNDEAVRAVRRAADLDRRAVRKRFVERFNARRMAHDYVRLYETVVGLRRTMTTEVNDTEGIR
jgi:glycosyltransferase involved in cell wall biosynthesis